MKRIALKLTVEELRLLVNLASDQLFRREFIDPRMPGHRAIPGEVAFGKALIGRLRVLIDEGSRDAASAPAAVNGHNRIPDAF